MVSWWARRQQSGLRRELGSPLEVEVMLLIEGGKIAAAYEDEVLDTVLPLMIDDHLHHKSFWEDFGERRERERYAYLVIAKSEVRPWWRPGGQRPSGSPQGEHYSNTAASLRTCPAGRSRS
ncbi:hypothetical protein HUT18_26170 [Streptomyces sp. NA04227]|uniref:hypothetical protein n=1 Tax=Streptomyces sp. NA04227 TaxID=2742136 RepID=UPI001591DC53|nr:hypothetical protein [Streptomyces sp. NA04227]QKW09353.1 hypothetical protein HUT18_26170 [Streptomyces sp. NA04227]